MATFDFDSCFPIAVFNACEQLELATNDPRERTVTGGLPYFGGPAASRHPRPGKPPRTSSQPLSPKVRPAVNFEAIFPPMKRWLVTQLVTAIQLFPAEDQTFRRWLSPAGNDAAAAAIATHLRKNATALVQFADRIDPTARDKPH